MKKFTLLLSLVALMVSCSTDDGNLKAYECHCTETHKFYRYINNEWVLENTQVNEVTNPDCSTNGGVRTVMHTDPTGGWSVREDIITNCN